MARNLQPRAKQARRLGVKLFEGIAKPFAKRPYPPGIHGPSKKMRRMSGYGKQLREKQIAKKVYGILERQFRNYYLKASSKTGDTGEVFLQLLESRLDNVVYRLGLATTRQQARQLVNHGHILVNKKKVDIPSFQVKLGQEISVKDTKLKSAYWAAAKKRLEKYDLPAWLYLDSAKLSGKLVNVPGKSEIAVPFDTTLIIEYYSK